MWENETLKAGGQRRVHVLQEIDICVFYPVIVGFVLFSIWGLVKSIGSMRCMVVPGQVFWIQVFCSVLNFKFSLSVVEVSFPINPPNSFQLHFSFCVTSCDLREQNEDNTFSVQHLAGVWSSCWQLPCTFCSLHKGTAVQPEMKLST